MADTNLYRITYERGQVKYGPRRVLGPSVGHSNAPGSQAWIKGKVVKVERIPLPDWEDVSEEFLK